MISKLNWSKILSWLLPMIYSSALLLIPLGMSYFFPIFSPFNLIKSFWLQTLGAVILIILTVVAKFWRWPGAGLSWTSLGRAVLPIWFFWLAWSLLSLNSVNFLQSWFGSYERQMGLGFYFWLAIWYSFIVYYFGGSRQERSSASIAIWQRGVMSSSWLMVIAGSVASIYAFLQFCGYDFALWQEPQLYTRAISTLGQPNFLGSFLLFTLPLSAYIFVFKTNFWPRVLIFSLVLIQLTGLVVSGSRAAWLALILSTGAAVLLLAWRRWRYWAIGLALIFVCLSVGAFYLLMPGRFLALGDWSGGSLALRHYFYQAAWPAISERPWFGVGLENGGEVLVKQYQSDWGVFMPIDGYTDKVHNSLLDIVIQTGFLGLIFWLGLYIFWAWQCWRLWQLPAGRAFALVAGTAMLAYGLSLMVGISDITNIFYFWVLAALVTAGNLALRFDQYKSVSLKNIYSSAWSRVAALASGVLLLVASGQIYLGINSLQADYYFLQFYRSLPSRQYFTADTLYSYAEASALNPVFKAHYQRAFSAFALSDWSSLPDISTRWLIREHLAVIEKNLPRQGYENKLTQARLTCFLTAGVSGQASFLTLIDFSPNRPGVYRDWGQCLQLSDSAGALSAYDQALSHLPQVIDSRLNQEHRDYLYFYLSRLQSERGLILESVADYQSAIEAYRLAYAYNPSNVSLLKSRANAYLQLKDYESAALLLNHGSLRQPTDSQWPLALAELFKAAGNQVKADYYQTQASMLGNTASTTMTEAVIVK